MDCRAAQDMLVDLLYGELDSATSKRLQEHLTKCSKCAAEYEQMGKVLKLVRENPLEEPSREVTGRILHTASVAARQRVERKKSSPAWWKRLMLNPAFAGAVVIVVVATVALVSVVPQKNAPESRAVAITPQTPEPAPFAKDTQVQDETIPEGSIPIQRENNKDSGEPKNIRHKRKEPASLKSTVRLGKNLSPAKGGMSGIKTMDSENSAVLSDHGNAGLDRVRHQQAGGGSAQGRSKQGRSKQHRSKQSEQRRAEKTSRHLAKVMKTKAVTEVPGTTTTTKTDKSAALYPSVESVMKAAENKKRQAPEKIAVHAVAKPVSKVSEGGEVPRDLLQEKQAPKFKKNEARAIGGIVASSDDLDMASQPSVHAEGSTQKPETRSTPQADAPSAQPPFASVQAEEEHVKEGRSGQEQKREKKSGPRLKRKSLESTRQYLYKRAKSLFRAGDCKAAISAIDRALKANPHHPMAADALFDKASCLIKLGRFSEAIGTYERIENEYPQRAEEAHRQLLRINP